MQAPLLNLGQYTQIKHHERIIYFNSGRYHARLQSSAIVPIGTTERTFKQSKKTEELVSMEIRSLSFQEELLTPLMHLIFPSTFL